MSDYSNLYRKTRDRIFRTEPGFPLRVKKEQPQTVTVSHRHEFCECVFVTGGEGRHQTEDRDPVPVSRGSVFVIPVGGHHAYTEASDDFSVINLMFDAARLPPVLLELYTGAVYKHVFLHKYSLYEKQDFPLTHLNEEVFSEFEILLGYLADAGKTPGEHCRKLGLFMAILSRLCAVWEIRSGPDVRPLDIPRLTSYLEQNFQKEIYLRDLLDLSSMSQATLLRHFRAALGVTPMIYLRNLRLRHAAELLLKTELSLKEIADQSGFFRMPYFFRAFRAFSGVSPQEYRRTRKKHEKISSRICKTGQNKVY